VVESDVAAALAVVSQGDTPLLLSPDDPRFARREREREERGNPREGRSFRDDRPERPDRERRPRNPNVRLAAYRIEVGKRQRVEPRQIVGALANEGGLERGDFGHIDIRPDFSLVELPADLPQATLDRLADTRISGKLIEIKPDRAPRRNNDRPDRPKRERY
jgi:ATP-dependent RNA helicase DeaD